MPLTIFYEKTAKCINHHPHATFLYKKSFNLCPRPQSESKSQHYKVVRKISKVFANIRIYLMAFYLLCKCCYDWTAFKVIFTNILLINQVTEWFIQLHDKIIFVCKGSPDYGNSLWFYSTCLADNMVKTKTCQLLPKSKIRTCNCCILATQLNSLMTKIMKMYRIYAYLLQNCCTFSANILIAEK